MARKQCEDPSAEKMLVVCDSPGDARSLREDMRQSLDTMSQGLPTDLGKIREHILGSGFSPVAVLIAGSRAISDSCWDRFSTDYDIVMVDFLRPFVASRYQRLQEISDKLAIALGKSVSIAPLLLPNLNLKGNLFVRKLADQQIIVYGSEKILPFLRKATGPSITFETSLFYLLETAEPVLTRTHFEPGNSFDEFRFSRRVLKSVVAACEVNLLLHNPQVRLPSSWVKSMELTRDLFEQESLGQQGAANAILRLLHTLSDLVKSGYSSPTLQESICEAALNFSYVTIQQARRILKPDSDWARFSLDTSFPGYFQFFIFTVCRKLGIRTPNLLSPPRARRMWLDLYSILRSGTCDVSTNRIRLLKQASVPSVGNYWSVLSPLPSL